LHLAAHGTTRLHQHMTSASYPPARVLVLEDEADLRDATVTYLNMEGLKAAGVASLGEAQAWMRTHPMDVLVLDLGLPDGDGLQWLKAQPDITHKGVIITTARESPEQRVAGIRAGADMYLVKPIQLAELSSLVTNLVRRLQSNTGTRWSLRKLNWTLVTPQGAVIKLTHSETVLLARLAQSPGEAVSRNELVSCLGFDPDTYDFRRMEILVRRLRNKIKQTLGHELPLDTVHKLGYAFTSPIQVEAI
jgi:two-component system OmpR family response regulator